MKNIRKLYMRKYSNRMEEIIKAVTGQELIEIGEKEDRGLEYTEFKFWATVEEYQVIMYAHNTLYK